MTIDMELTMNERIDKMMENLTDYRRRVRETITKLATDFKNMKEYAANLETKNENLKEEIENLQLKLKDQQEEHKKELNQVEQQYEQEIEQLKLSLALHENKSLASKKRTAPCHPALDEDNKSLCGSQPDVLINKHEILSPLLGSQRAKITENQKINDKTHNKGEIKPKAKRRRLFNLD